MQICVATKQKVNKIVPVLNQLSTLPWRSMEEWEYSSTILDLGIRWRRVIKFTPLPLYPWEKSPWYPLYRRMSESQSRSGCCGYPESNPGRPSRRPSQYKIITADDINALLNNNNLRKLFLFFCVTTAVIEDQLILWRNYLIISVAW
jgi:hypothetical protein